MKIKLLLYKILFSILLIINIKLLRYNVLWYIKSIKFMEDEFINDDYHINDDDIVFFGFNTCYLNIWIFRRDRIFLYFKEKRK